MNELQNDFEYDMSSQPAPHDLQLQIDIEARAIHLRKSEGTSLS